MQTKTFLKVSAALTLGILAGCQTVQAPNENTNLTPTRQSTSTVEITNTLSPEEGSGEMPTQQMIKPSDLSREDQEAFAKADAAKNPKLCESIAAEGYRKFCVMQASNKDLPPAGGVKEEQQCDKTEAKDGKTTCLIFEKN